MHRVGTRQGHRDKRMAHLMMSYHVALVRIEQTVFLLQPCDDTFDRLGKVIHYDGIRAAARRHERSLIDQIGEIGPRESGRQGRDFLNAEVCRDMNISQVHNEYLDTSVLIGPIDQDLAIEASSA